MPGTWKLRKKKEEEASKVKHREMHRTKSSKEDKEGHYQVTCPRRTATISGGAPARVNSNESTDSATSPDHFYSVGRQSKKRPALSCTFEDSIGDFNASNAPSTNAFKIYFEDDVTSFETVAIAQEGVPLINVLEAAFYEQKKDFTGISDCMIVSLDDATGDSCVADIHSPSTNYLGSTIQILSQNNSVENEIESPLSEVVMMSVQACLDYFDTHGVIELPTNKCYEDIYRPPIVDKPIDPIESLWDDLPIEEHVKNNLNSAQMSCQQAIWELIVTEHSFLKQLEIVINIYMRSLEFIRRQGLLTDVNYHNIFGYMEEIYKVHEQLWTWTLYPCLEKVRIEHCPLDVNDIILRFPTQFSQDFEIYEQHCAFETTNLNSLDEAMNDADFRAYVKWCESQPECNRLRLKDFLAIPRQRLMKYQLLFHAILKKTPQNSNSDELKQIIEDVSLFVDTVNGALKTQDETTRVQQVMKKIVGYAPVEIPGDLKEFVQPHTHLDLMAPMPDVDVTKIRLLVLEGKLRFRDQKDKMVVHVFLFSDMLLITKPVKRNVENYIIVRPPYKISNIQVGLKGDAVCCVVLNEFRVLSALFTLKAHSAHIAKGWRDQIISTQDFYDSALTRTVPTIHILQSLRQERTLHGVSQEFSFDPPDSRLASTTSPLLSAGTGFHRVNSNDSTLSSNSSTAFLFDGQMVSPRPGRRGTIPSHGFTESKRSFRRNSANPSHSLSTSLSFGITPPMWQRTSSLNALPERKMSDSARRASHSHLKLRQSNSVSDYNCVQRSSSDPQRADSLGTLTQSKGSKPNDFADACPVLENAAPLQESDSNTDDEEYSSSTSPTNPPNWSSNADTPGITIRRHRRNKSQPNSMYVIDTSTPDLSRHNERDESMYTVPVNGATGGEGKLPAQLTEDSLMSEIIKELSKTDSGSSKKLQHDFEETYDSFDTNFKMQRKRSMSLHSSIGGLEKRFHTRRKAIHQLDNIFETTDEDGDSKLQEISMDSTYFARNTKLRRSKSSFELSFHRRLKPPSPLITHMQRSFEKESSEDYSHTKLSSHISTPILPSHQLKREPIPVQETAQAMEGTKRKKEKKHSEKKRYGLPFFKRERSSSPTESKWGFKGLRRAMTMSVDTGLNRTGITAGSTDGPTSPAKKSTSSSKKATRRNSPKIMIVVRSENK